MELKDKLKEFNRADHEGKKRMALESAIDATRDAVEQITINRRVLELSHGMSTEEFDAKLNEFCEEANEKFGNMDELEIHMYMLKDILAKKLDFLGED